MVSLRGDQVALADAEQFAQQLLGSMVRDGARYRYEARLPRGQSGAAMQVLVGTVRGDVVSATFVPAARP